MRKYIIVSAVIHLSFLILLSVNLLFFKKKNHQQIEAPVIYARAVYSDPSADLKKQQMQALKEMQKQQELLDIQIKERLNQKQKKIDLENEIKLKAKQKKEQEKKDDLLQKQRIQEQRKEELKRKQLEEQQRKEEQKRQQRKQEELRRQRLAKEEQQRKTNQELRSLLASNIEGDLQSETQILSQNISKSKKILTEVEKYKYLIQNKIQNNLNTQGIIGKACNIQLNLITGGYVSLIANAKGNKLACDEAKRAIKRSEPFPVASDVLVFEHLRQINLTVTPLE